MLALDRIEKLLWICLLLFVPVSASPLLPLGSGTLVRPLAIIPAAMLLMLAALRVFAMKQRPTPVKGDGINLLLLFVGYILLSGLASIAALPDDTFKGQTPLDSFVRALLTLLVGIVFYLVARIYIRTAADVRLTIRCLFLGLTASISLAALQVVAIVERGPTLRTVQAITDLFAVHYDGLASRAQGMTFEPSWLATQIIVLMMPVLVARSISRQSFIGAPADKREIRRVLPGFGVVLAGLLCAGSRFGLAAAVGLIVLGVLMAAWRGRFGAAIALSFFLMAGGAGIAAMGNLQSGAGANYVLGPLLFLTNGSALANSTDSQQQSETVVNALALAGRVAVAQAAAGTWLAHPLTGVSFGNDYRYFRANAPDWAFTTALFQQSAKEGVGWIDRYSPEKGNAKNFFLRLLAETGVFGFLFFALFFVRQMFSAPARDSYFSYFRLSSAAALLFAGFNQDSFADPMLWIVLVMCSAMGRLQTPLADCAMSREYTADRNRPLAEMGVSR